MKKWAKVLLLTTLIALLSQTLPACTAQLGASSSSKQVSAVTPSAPTPTPEPTPDMSASYIYEANPQLTPVNYSSKAILPPSEDMGQEYIDRMIFLCDSTLYGLKWYGLLKDGGETRQIWTGETGTLTLGYQSTVKIVYPEDGAMRTIREAVELKKPEYLIITLGINGISFMDEDYFVREYSSLVTDIREISPDTNIILQSIFPISPTFVHWGDITNAMVTQANGWILRIAEQTGCPYLDTISVLLDDSGNVKEELTAGDGLHFSPDGLNIILNYIRSHAYTPEDR